MRHAAALLPKRYLTNSSSLRMTTAAPRQLFLPIATIIFAG
jgi:hypothetical protein